MSKKLFSKFIVLLLVVGLLFAVAPTKQALAATTVLTEAELKAALADAGVTEIVLGANIALTSTAYVTRDGVSIDGGGFTITGPGVYHGIDVTGDNVTISNLTITGSAKSNLQFYEATGGVVTNVVLANAGNAGLMVNGSQVTISNVTTTNNAWGGINVDQGSGVTEIPLLTVTNVTTHTSPIAGVTAAIWVDTGDPTWVAVGDLYTIVAPPNGYLVFYDNTEFTTIAANFPIHNETLDIYYATIQEAINAANPGNTITVNGTHVLTSVVNVNKAITLTCAAGAKIQVSGTGDRFDVSAAATIRDCEIEKTDEVGEQNIIRLRASGITISDNTIWGYWDKADPYYVSRAMVINAGDFTDLLITGNTIYNLRQPAYISGTHTGTVSNNYVHGTKGWVLEGGNLTFSGNTWADNVGDIAILSAVPATYYTDIVAMSATNNGAVIEDQRMSPALLSVVYVDDSAAAGGNGTQATPYQTIQDGINRVISGGTVNIAAGTYAEDLEIGKSITLLGPNAAISPNTGTRAAEAIVAPVDQVGVADPAVLITASNISVTIKGLTFDMVNTTDQSDRFVELINKTGVTMVVEKNQFLNAPSCINGNWYITGTTSPFSLTLKDNYFTGSKDSNGIALWGNGHTVDIQDNVWTDNGGWAVNFNNVTGTFINNQVLDTIDNGTEWYDEQAGFLFASANTLNLTNNTFDGLPNPSIRLYPTFSGTLTATDNTFSNTEDATMGVIRISDGAVLTGVNFEENLFLNNPIVVQNLGTGTASLDVTPNWWGSIAGPTAAQLVGTTTFNPWCANAACTEFLPATVTIAPVAPVFCGVTPTSTIEINVAGIPASILAQGYQLTLHFDPDKTSIASDADIVQGGFLPVGTGFTILNIDNINGKVEIASAIMGTATNDSTKPLVKITLTHKGVVGDINLSLSDVLLSDNYDMQPIPVEVSTTPVVLTLNPAVLNVTKNPVVGYCTLAEAVAGASTTVNETLQLQADIAIPTTVTVDKALTLDLNAKVATYTSGTDNTFAIKVTGSGNTLTVVDGASGGGGKLSVLDGDGGTLEAGQLDGRGIEVLNGASFVLQSGTIEAAYAGVYVRPTSSMTMNGGTISSPLGYGVIVFGNGTAGSASLAITGGTIDVAAFAVSGNGSSGYGGTNIAISGGSLTSDNTGIYHPQDGILTISGTASISGYNGIEMKAGNLSVTGGTILGTGAFADPLPNDNGSANTGDAILLNGRDAYTGDITLNITGGTITSTNAYALRDYKAADQAHKTSLVAISGGEFRGGAGKEAVTFSDETKALAWTDTTGLKITNGLYNIDPAAFVFSPLRTYVTGSGMYGIQAIPPILNVELNIEYFELQTAVDAATAGNTLKFQLDYTIPATVTINKALTLNTNGKTISRTAAFTPDSANNSILVSPGGDVTITGGGTITATSGNSIRIEGNETTQAKVKLESGHLYGPNASVVIIGNRSYTAHDPAYKSLFEMTGGNTDETVLVLGNGAEANISGGTLIGWAPIMGNGTVDAGQNINNGGTKITIGGTAQITGTDVAIYHPQDGLLTITGGTITGTNGIEMKAGDLVITGGTIQGTGACALPTATGNGSTDTGDAILIFNRNGYGAGLTMDVTISGSPIITSNCYALREATLTGETSRLGVAKITGGSFTGTLGAVSFTTNTDTNLDLLPGGLYNTDPKAFVYVPYGTYLDGSMYGIRLLPTISGLVTMQGRPTVRAGVPLALNATAYTDTSDDMTEVNYAFIGVELGTYTFTTDQPRYLNITATIVIDSLTNRSLPLLRLLGGDVDGDDLIYVNDASIVGTAWGSTVDSSANINFDGVVNIQDLALVGGNYGQTSASAYGAWLQ